MQLSNGTLLQGGKYKIARFISAGAFGNTYEGVHTMMDTKVAIKEFFPKMFCNRDENTSHITVATQSNRELVDKLRKKFVEEAKSIFKMNHPNIVKVHDIFEENGSAYYVMDFIDGKSLGDMVKAHGIFSENEAVGYIRQVADALKYVHSLNRLHLDIKPGNIMVDKNGNAMLIDFGASKHYDMESGENTSTLMGVNTKGYAPVEQSTQSFTKFSPATDIYALGATLYKLLTGITPPDANLLLAGEETLKPLPSNVSVSTRNAVSAAMSLRRADRPQSIDDFLTILNVQASSNADNEETLFVGGNNEQTEIEQQVEGCKDNAPSLKNQQSRSHTTIAMCADFFKKSHIALSVLWVLNLILRFLTIYWFQPWAYFNDAIHIATALCIIYLFTGVYGLYKIIQYKKKGLFFTFIGSILSEGLVLSIASVALVLLLFASMSIKKNGVSYYDCLKAKKCCNKKIVLSVFLLLFLGGYIHYNYFIPIAQKSDFSSYESARFIDLGVSKCWSNANTSDGFYDITQRNHLVNNESFSCSYHPNKQDFEELITNCEWTVVKLDNVIGYKVKGSTGKSIFLPVEGFGYGDDILHLGAYSYYLNIFLGTNFIKSTVYHCYFYNHTSNDRLGVFYRRVKYKKRNA